MRALSAARGAAYDQQSEQWPSITAPDAALAAVVSAAFSAVSWCLIYKVIELCFLKHKARLRLYHCAPARTERADRSDHCAFRNMMTHTSMILMSAAGLGLSEQAYRACTYIIIV